MAENVEMISKKELLSKYGISYGALYRWKRMGLLPEEWFCKTSTVTGQETYFPKQAVCERIERILAGKGEGSLDDLAKDLGVEEKTNILILDTVYGKKTYRLSDLRQVTLVNAFGEELILNEKLGFCLKGGMQNEKK